MIRGANCTCKVQFAPLAPFLIGRVEKGQKCINSVIQISFRFKGSDREWLMSWCEKNMVDSLFGLAKNARLKRIIGKEIQDAREQFLHSGTAARVFKDFTCPAVRIHGLSSHHCLPMSTRRSVYTLRSIALAERWRIALGRMLASSETGA